MTNELLQLTVFLDENDLLRDRPLYEAIVQRLLHLKIAGATVLRGEMGYGRHALIHQKSLFGVADDRPMLIVAVDDESKIRAALPEIRSMMLTEGLITLTRVELGHSPEPRP